MSKKRARYWDSNIWLGILNAEPDKIVECSQLLERARDGEFLIVSSAITLAEVVRMRGTPVKLDRDKDQIIRDFFKRDYISVRNVDRQTAELARELVWKYRDIVENKKDEVKPWDAIHMATAMRLSIPLLNTYDPDLLQLDGKERCSDGSFLEVRPPEGGDMLPLFSLIPPSYN